MKVIGELIRAQLQISASDITPTGTGLIYFNTTTGVKWHNGTSWFVAADLSSAQTMTNKTLTSPAITTPTGIVKGDVGLGNVDNTSDATKNAAVATLTNKTLTSPVINTPTGIVKGDVGLGNVDNTSDATKNAATATLTNKTLTSPLLTEVATPSTPASGFVAVYAKTDKKIYKLDSTGTEVEVGAGSGGSGRNYFSDYFDGTKPVGTVTNGLTATGNRTTGQTTWGADNTSKLTIANNTTNPLRQTGDFKITHVAVGTAFVESPMVQLDNADLSKAVSINLDLTGNTLSGDFDIVVMRYNSSGTYQETISVAGTASTGSPASALLPTGTTRFNGFFISSNTQTDYYSVRFRRLSGSATTSVQFDSFFAGPQTVLAGFSSTEWQTYTLSLTGSVSNPTFGTITRNQARWRRSGDSMEIRYDFEQSTAGTAGSGTYKFGLPSGYTIDSNKINTTGASTSAPNIGSASSGTQNDIAPVVFDTTNIALYSQAGAGFIGSAVLALSSAGRQYSFTVNVPISQWTSNTTLAERAVEEYASNDGTGGAAAGATYNTGMAYGLGGSQFASVASTTAASRTSYLVRFTTPILDTDHIEIEVYNSTANKWAPITQWTYTNLVVDHHENDSFYGMGWYSTSSTDIYVTFGNKGRGNSSSSGAGFGANGAAWSDIAASASYKWRVRKVSGGASVGYPISYANIYDLANGMVRADTGNGHGSTNTRIRRLTNFVTTGTAITGIDSSTLGTTFTINEKGIYSISYSDRNTASAAAFGLSLNSANLTTNIFSLSAAERLVYSETTAQHGTVSATVRCNAGDVIRPHTNASPNSTSNEVQVIITQICRLP